MIFNNGNDNADDAVTLYVPYSLYQVKGNNMKLSLIAKGKSLYVCRSIFCLIKSFFKWLSKTQNLCMDECKENVEDRGL